MTELVCALPPRAFPSASCRGKSRPGRRERYYSTAESAATSVGSSLVASRDWPFLPPGTGRARHSKLESAADDSLLVELMRLRLFVAQPVFRMVLPTRFIRLDQRRLC